MDYLLFILFLIGGYILGRLYRKTPIGVLRVDTSDPDDGPYLFLELSNPDKLIHGKHVTMRVSTENYISQK